MLVIVLECLWMVWSCMPAIPILLTVDAGEQHQQNESSCKSDGTENIGGFQTPRKWSRSPLFIGYIPVRSHQCLNIESPVCAFISRSSSPRRVILAPPTWDILWPMIINYSLLSIEWNWNYINIYIYNHVYIYIIICIYIYIFKGFWSVLPYVTKKRPQSVPRPSVWRALRRPWRCAAGASTAPWNPGRSRSRHRGWRRKATNGPRAVAKERPKDRGWSCWWFSGKHTTNYGKSQFLMGKLTICDFLGEFWENYPLVNIQKKTMAMWKITMFNGKTHYQWPFSIAMLVYQRVWDTEFLLIFWWWDINKPRIEDDSGIRM